MPHWIGTALDPAVRFGEADVGTKEAADELLRDLRANGTKIIRRFQRGGREIALTRIGGLFIEVEEFDVSEDEARRADRQDAARCLNLFICDLAVQGVVSQPVGQYNFSAANIDDERATCGATAGRQNGARNLGPQRELADERSFEPVMWQHAEERRLDSAIALDIGTRLEAIHASLPPLVVAAYDYGQMGVPTAGGVVDAWMVVEQILNHLWEVQYVPGALDRAHRNRLRDFRNFTANQRAEVLFAAGMLAPDVYARVQVARKHRNDLAHNAKLNQGAQFECKDAMQSMIGVALGLRFG